MIDKSNLRKLYKSVRNSISPCEKECFDLRIFTKFVNSEYYLNSTTILIYVSFGSEVSTINIIKQALTDGKKVAVPRCNDNEMLFYEIKSFDDLKIGAFGISTVDDSDLNPVFDYEGCVCVVPGLSFERSGSRLGYGGGYYDRFLADKKIITVGLCYERCISPKLLTQEHDIKINFLITEK